MIKKIYKEFSCIFRSTEELLNALWAVYVCVCVCGAQPYVNSNPTMCLGEVHGLIRADRVRHKETPAWFRGLCLPHMAPST